MRWGGDGRARGLAALLALGLTLVALAAGCGGEDESSTEGWADSVCTAFSDWREAVVAAGESLRAGSLDEDGLRDAVDELQEATDTFAEDLRDLPPLETDAGAEAQETLDDLAESVDTAKEDIRTTVGDAEGKGVQGVLGAGSAIAATVATMGEQLQTAFGRLEQLDASNEIADAFESSDACSSLTASE
jgi:hypothetical protein